MTTPIQSGRAPGIGARRLSTTLALALCVLGCGLMPGPVALLTGGAEECSIRAGAPTSIQGVLIADPQSGTAIEVDPTESQWGPGIAGSTLPVMWPMGYTGRRVPGGEVEVLRAGEVVVTTGTHVVLSLQYIATMGNTSSSGDVEFQACGGSEVPAPTG